MSATSRLAGLPARFARGERGGITSICSAHPLVIEAALLEGIATGMDVLIEATCNQVNQEGGYTGMTPADFRSFVEDIATRLGFDTSRLILGGDHLGPNPWKHLPADEAMQRADIMMDAFVRAGFTKIHLDTSMGCLGEPVALPDAVTAERAARLARIAEMAASQAGYDLPVYIIGTEVPIPGGAMEALDHLELTTPAAAVETVEVHRRAFAALGLEDAFARAIGVVVQPGVEFGNENVVVYDSAKATALSGVLRQMPQFVFEAHSTDYQPQQALAALVHDASPSSRSAPASPSRCAKRCSALTRSLLSLTACRKRRHCAARWKSCFWPSRRTGRNIITATPTTCACSAISPTATASATTGRIRRLRLLSTPCSSASKAAPSRRR